MTDTRLESSFASAAPTAARRSPLDRVLGIVTEVHAGEGVTAVLLGLALFLLLMAYYIIKPVREALILLHPAGAEYKSWMGAAIAMMLLVLVPAYSKLADRLPRNRLVVGVTLFFASHLVMFAVANLAGVGDSLWLALVFFIWVGIFNMMLVAQLWAFANDIYDQERGKRLFVIVGLGASFGAIAGGVVTSVLSRMLHNAHILLVSAAALVCVAGLTQAVHRRESAAALRKSSKPPEPEQHDTSSGFSLVLRHRYLTLIAAFSLVYTFVNTNGEYMLSKLIKAAAVLELPGGSSAEIGAFIGAKYNALFTWVNVLSFLMQFVVVSRLVKRLGFSAAFLIFPVISLIDGMAVAIAPVLAVLFVGKIAENSTDYSLNNTLRQMLWLPTTRDMKYKAKQAVDAFFIRMGDVASAGWVVVATTLLPFGVRGFAITNIVLVGVWLWLGWAISRHFRQMAPDQAPAA